MNSEYQSHCVICPPVKLSISWPLGIMVSISVKSTFTQDKSISHSVVSDSLQPHELCPIRQSPLPMGFSRQVLAWVTIPSSRAPSRGAEPGSPTLRAGS